MSDASVSAPVKLQPEPEQVQTKQPKEESERVVWLFRVYRFGGPLVLFFIAAYIAYLGIGRAAAGYPNLVVLISVTLTTVYSFLFLIAPEFHRDRGLETLGVCCLALLLLATFFVSGLLISIYADKAFHANGPLYVIGLLKDLARLIFADDGTRGVWIESGIRILIGIHFLLFVILFSAIDCVFWAWSPREQDQLKFARVFLIVDVPIVLATGAILYVKSHIKPLPEGDLFEAGAISFQLIVGSIAAYFLDHFETFHRGIVELVPTLRAIGTRFKQFCLSLGL